MPNKFYIGFTTGFTIIGLPLSERIHPRGFPYNLDCAKPANKKTFKCVTENANSGQIWALDPNLNIQDNIILIV